MISQFAPVGCTLFGDAETDPESVPDLSPPAGNVPFAIAEDKYAVGSPSSSDSY